MEEVIDEAADRFKKTGEVYSEELISPQFISMLGRFLYWLPCVILRKKIKTYFSEKQNYNSSAVQRVY